MPRVQHICILGGTGFVGKALVRELAKTDRYITVLSRHPERHRDLLTIPGVRLRKANIHDAAVLERFFADMDAVINLVGILNQMHHQNFRSVHVELPRKVMKACWKAGVSRLLHMSALNADAGKATSRYLRTKGEAEDLLHVDAGDRLNVTRFRPSVIFGQHDQFFNRFSKLLSVTPLFFPLACPRARFAPVYVGDVAQAFVKALDDPATYHKRYDLCGPRSYTLMELVTYAAREAGLRRTIIPLSDLMSRLQAVMLSMVPGKPFTMDNYRSMLVDSVCADNGLPCLGITPTPLESVVPGYIGSAGVQASYDHFRSDHERTI